MATGPRGIALGLRAVRTLASSEVLDRLRMRDGATRVLYRATRDGFRAAGTAGRTFTAAKRLGAPARLRPTVPDLFDLTPTDEQQMLQAMLREFAGERLRPVALDADAACAAPADLLAEGAELGIGMLGVPEALGGAQDEASAVTSVLAAEALAHGDMGLALALLAPAGVAAALSLWGDERQQAAYLPAFTGDDVPAAAVAVLEPHPLFDPFAVHTRARAVPGGYTLSGLKAQVPRAQDAELLLVAARLDGAEPALFLVEPARSPGVEVRPAPAMGVRAAATGDVRLHDVHVPAENLLAGGDPAAYAGCIRRARLAWCALALGTARAVLDHVIPYVNERRAFGEPISHRQAVAFAVADIATELEGMRLLTLRAAALADAGKDFAREVALARSLCAAKGREIGSDGVQLLGGHGFVCEHPVERWYRDLTAIGVMEGALLV
ncbi:MAG TPA: acyl-CoA dehydrogenase family protein [Solirubrobacteraceae bacterium]|nr:acyl-CoA dehydrogenase family protein [Solirubrobacteraceae bacterium]